MTIYKARKVSMFVYLVAAALLFIYLIFDPTGVAKYALIVGMAALFLIGFYIASTYSRCPKCGHVVQVGMMKVTSCAFCDFPINENTSFKF